MLKSQSNTILDFKRNAYEGLTAMVNANYKICAQYFGNMIDAAVIDTVEKAEHKEEIDLGAFKQKVDHGAAHRRAAIGLITAMYDKGRERVNIQQVVEILVTNGFKDSNEDVLIAALGLLNRIAATSPLALGSFIQDLIQKLANKYNIQIKSVKKSEKAENISRAIIKSIYHLNSSLKLQKEVTISSPTSQTLTSSRTPTEKPSTKKSKCSKKTSSE